MGPTEFQFTTIPAVDPFLIDSIPFAEETGFQIDGDITLVFNEMVTTGIGDIVISNTVDATDTRVIAVEDASQVFFDGNYVIIDPVYDLAPNAVYNIQLAHGVIIDSAGNPHAGISDSTALSFNTGIAGISYPQLINSYPLDEATDFQVGGNITLLFDEVVVAGFGDIVIRNSIDPTDTRTISVADHNQVAFNGSNVTINPELDLVPNAAYNIEIASGVIVDLEGNAYAGISNPTALNFTATNADTSDPQLTNSNPLDGATDFQVDGNITLSFDEAVAAGAGDIIIINNVNAADTRTISVADANQVTFSGSNVIINPTLDLQSNAAYNIQLADGVIVDLVGNAYVGISDPTALNFTATNADITDPLLTNSHPLDDAQDFPVDSNITLSFDEAVTAGAGDIVITNKVNAADTRTISVADANQVTFNGSNVIINPTLDLQSNAAYNIQLDDGVIVDLVGNAYAGISDEVTLNFSTVVV